MNIGIIVYSQTGNTRAVAGKLKEQYEASGHTVSLEPVTAVGDEKNFRLKTVPPVDSYDALIFGAPVHAFSLAPVMAAYLEQLPPLRDKKVACFVTKQLPFNWTGGNRAIAQMKKICQAKGAAVEGTAIVVWAESRRGESIAHCLKSLGGLF